MWSTTVQIILGSSVAPWRVCGEVQPSCWSGKFTEAFCCDQRLQNGHPSCWDAQHSFQTCCPKHSARNTGGGNFSEASWPPPTLLSAVDVAGPLSFLAGTSGQLNASMLSDEPDWFPIATGSFAGSIALSGQSENSDLYSKGTQCILHIPDVDSSGKGIYLHPGPLIEDPLQTSFSAGGSNCRPYLHCPLWLPIAVAIIDRAASMSVLLWLSKLDGRPRRTHGFEPVNSSRPTLFDIWSSLVSSIKTLGSEKASAEWLTSEFDLLGLNEADAQTLTSRCFRHYTSSPGNLGRRVNLSPHLCFTCCIKGTNRLHLVFARNPFTRLTSYFRLRWLGSSSKKHNSWVDFPQFVDYVARLDNETDAYSTYKLPVSKPLRSLAADFVDEDLLHTRSASEWIRQSMQASQWTSRYVHVVRIEHLEEETAELAAILCSGYKYCEQLPSFTHSNSFKDPPSEVIWRAIWSSEDTVQRVVHRYRADFEAFGYSTEVPTTPRSSGVVTRGLQRVAVRRWISS
jgi:hypothetical protein